jgi:AcrR family transcriptional regulator
MSDAYSRKKQPEAVRRALLDEAAKLAALEGLSAVTIDAVAKAAGVTKGGLFHHFPSKRALIEGAFGDLLASLDDEIAAVMAGDPEPRGRFTRAYLEALFAELERGATSPWAALCAGLMGDAAIRRSWSEWFSERLLRHRDTDDAPELGVVRLAADGAWYATVLGVEGGFGGDLAALRERLIAMTRGG